MYSDEEQMDRDISWFAIDKNGIVAHFTSGGMKLPKEFRLTKAENEELIKGIMELPQICGCELLLGSRKGRHSLEEIKTNQRYLGSLSVVFSTRGLISYDKIVDESRRSKEYALSSMPLSLLPIKLIPDHYYQMMIQSVFSDYDFMKDKCVIA